MSRSRRLRQNFYRGITASIGGFFGNIIAGIVQNNFSQPNLYTYIATLAGMVAAVLLYAQLENWRDKDAENLLSKIENHRSNLRDLLERHRDGQVWTDYHVVNWRDNQSEIASLKETLETRGVRVPYSMVDEYPPPKVRGFVRIIELVRKVIIFPVIFLISFAFVITTSPQIYQAFQFLVEQLPVLPMPEPEPPVRQVATLTPEIMTATTTDIGLVEQSLTPTMTPIPTLIPTPTMTSTPTSIPITATFTPTATSTLFPELVARLNTNVRSGPGMAYEVINFLLEGSFARILARSSRLTNVDDWFLIELEDGSIGWVSANLVTVSEAVATSVPIVLTIPPTPTITNPILTITTIDSLGNGQYYLEWEFSRSLQERETFAIRISPFGFPNEAKSITYLNETSYAMDVNQLFSDTFTLSIAVVELDSLNEPSELNIVVESTTVDFPLNQQIAPPTPTRVSPPRLTPSP